MIVKSINKSEVKKELKNCPKIIRDYIRALENSKEIDTKIIEQAKHKIKELSERQQSPEAPEQPDTKALHIADVVGQSEQFICSQCGKETTEWLDGMCEDCTLEGFSGK